MSIKVVTLKEIEKLATKTRPNLNSRRLKIINDIPYVSEKIVELFPHKDAYPHYHLYAESYYILKGKMLIKNRHISDSEYKEDMLSEGSLLTIEKNTIHHLINNFDESTVFLSLCPQDVLIQSKIESPNEKEKGLYICKICGAVHNPILEQEINQSSKPIIFENLNDDYRCPVCNVPKNMFAKI